MQLRNRRSGSLTLSDACGTRVRDFPSGVMMNFLVRYLLWLVPLVFAFSPGTSVAEAIVTDCGALISSRTITNNSPIRTSLQTYIKLATTTVTVPSGQSRCIKVLVTAKTFCAGPGQILDFCDIRVTLNGVETMQPAGGNFKAMDSEDNTSSGHAYLWVRRIGPGTHSLSLEVRVRDSRSVFEVDDLTFDVQQLL